MSYFVWNGRKTSRVQAGWCADAGAIISRANGSVAATCGVECGNIDFCPYDKHNDEDSDFVCGDVDACPSDAENDEDSDRLCAKTDSCPLDPNNDADGDKMCLPEDKCPQDLDDDRDSDNLCHSLSQSCSLCTPTRDREQFVTTNSNRKAQS